MKVWLIRHGESETNRDSLWTGWLDVPLTEKGRQDATAVSKTLAGIKFDKIYSSDLVRAKTTAELAIPGCEYEELPIIREIHVGNLEGKPFAAAKNEDGVYMNKDGYAAFDGESHQSFSVRVASFMKMLESEKCENIAAFTHGGFIRMFLDLVAQMPLPRDKICSGNCVVAIFEFSHESWKLHSWINLI